MPHPLYNLSLTLCESETQECSLSLSFPQILTISDTWALIPTLAKTLLLVHTSVQSCPVHPLLCVSGFLPWPQHSLAGSDFFMGDAQPGGNGSDAPRASHACRVAKNPRASCYAASIRASSRAGKAALRPWSEGWAILTWHKLSPAGRARTLGCCCEDAQRGTPFSEQAGDHQPPLPPTGHTARTGREMKYMP